MIEIVRQPLEHLPRDLKKKLKKKSQPEWIDPMLATLTKNSFSDDEWIFERKFDGERCLVFKKGEDIFLRSRNRKLLNSQYPEIVEAFGGQPEDFILDGEIVAFEKGLTSFSKLQHRMHRKEPEGSIKVFYYAFDLIHLSGFQLSEIPLRNRKSLLKRTLDFSSRTIRYTPHRNGVGEEYFQEACRKGWEGLIAKEADTEYVHGRSKKWLKFKCGHRQELVICGYTDPKGERKGFGALLVGFYENGDLRYAGKVGTGYDEETLERIHGMFKPLEQDQSPFDLGKPGGLDDIHWLTPKLVGEFRFSEWTSDNKLRHPSFLGLRDDKKAEEVTREEDSSSKK